MFIGLLRSKTCSTMFRLGWRRFRIGGGQYLPTSPARNSGTFRVPLYPLPPLLYLVLIVWSIVAQVLDPEKGCSPCSASARLPPGFPLPAGWPADQPPSYASALVVLRNRPFDAVMKRGLPGRWMVG